MELTLSPLGHTWILDLDGTIVEHNGYKLYGEDRFLDGAEEFLKSIPDGDMIIFLTSRTIDCADLTEEFLNKHGVKYDHIIYDAPYGERILINDNKPSGLVTGYAVNNQRDARTDITVRIDSSL